MPQWLVISTRLVAVHVVTLCTCSNVACSNIYVQVIQSRSRKVNDNQNQKYKKCEAKQIHHVRFHIFTAVTEKKLLALCFRGTIALKPELLK
jgi:hypothetical protein